MTLQASYTLKSNEWPSLERAVSLGDVKTFRTKRAALDAGRPFGWASAVRLVRRFETVWLCGRLDFQAADDNAPTYSTFRAPRLQWIIDRGIQRVAVTIFRRSTDNPDHLIGALDGHLHQHECHDEGK